MRRLLGVLVAGIGIATGAGVFLPHSPAPVHADGGPLPNPPPAQSLCAGASPIVVTLAASTGAVYKCVPT